MRCWGIFLCFKKYFSVDVYNQPEFKSLQPKLWRILNLLIETPLRILKSINRSTICVFVKITSTKKCCTKNYKYQNYIRKNYKSQNCVCKNYKYQKGKNGRRRGNFQLGNYSKSKTSKSKDLKLRTDNKLSDSGLYERQWVDKKPCLAQVR